MRKGTYKMRRVVAVSEWDRNIELTMDCGHILRYMWALPWTQDMKDRQIGQKMACRQCGQQSD